MRSLVFVLVACSVHLAHAAPARDARGWCPRAAQAKRAPVTKSFEITRDLRNVSPMRKVTLKRDPGWRDGFTSFQAAYARDDGPARLGGGRDVTIVGNKLRIATFEHSCHDTNMGCFPNEWSSPGVVQIEEDVGDACIAWSSQLGKGLAVGIGNEMRMYELREDGGVVAGPRVKTPVLEGIEGIDDGAIVLQEPKGGVWVARWEKTPTLTKVEGIVGRVRGFRAINGAAYAFTDDAFYLLDETTMKVRWKLDGEVWGVMEQDVPKRFFVLTIERDAKPRVVVRLLDERGKQLRHIVVYEGADIVEAHLESTYIPFGKDEVESLYLAYVATK